MNLFKRIYISLIFKFYRNLYIPYKSKRIKNKKEIVVIFPIWNLGMWKTESLYKSMLAHPRFKPHLILGHKLRKSDLDELINYCNTKNYDYFILEDVTKNLWEPFHPDIIFPQQPYESEFLYNFKSLFCYVTYAFNNSTLEDAFKTNMLLNCWQIYYENKTLCDYYNNRMGDINKNGYATGIPTMDDLNNFIDKTQNKSSKKNNKIIIIFAPHHSITAENWCQTSSFLETGELMLEIAEKYSDKIYWIFKPHPVLKKNLYRIWGQKRTDSYYDKWKNSYWSRLETGRYFEIFNESDALIHDCGSFIVEYQVTGKPVMFLTKKKESEIPWNDFFKEALNLHYKGNTREQIEFFIKNVINKCDSLKEDRKIFVSQYLTPPLNRTACDNIIDCILSKDAKKKYR